MDQIKLEVGKRYRKTKEVKIISYCEDENCYKGDDDYLYQSNGKVWSGFYDPIPLTDIIGPAIKEPTTEKSSLVELQSGDVLTDKDGREWEVDRPIHNVAWGEEGWLQSYAFKPKPKRLKGIINVYDNKGYVWCERIEVADHDEAKYLVACINLDQFEEGEGL